MRECSDEKILLVENKVVRYDCENVEWVKKKVVSKWGNDWQHKWRRIYVRQLRIKLEDDGRITVRKMGCMVSLTGCRT